MHDVTAPNIIMNWRILCANPVKPEDWELVYNKSIHYGNSWTKISILFLFSSTKGDTFEMRLAVKPGVDLPTMPTIRVYAVIGFPKVETRLAGQLWQN